MTAILFYFAIGALSGLMTYPVIWLLCLAIVAGDEYKMKKVERNPNSLIALIINENPLVAIAIILGAGVVFALIRDVAIAMMSTFTLLSLICLLII